MVRAGLRRLNAYLSRHETRRTTREPAQSPELVEAIDRLRTLDQQDRYFEEHLQRLARTLTLVPEPRSTRRVLELGCYMQITPFLKLWRGYEEVRGAYYGALGAKSKRMVSVSGQPFELDIDLFDAERDRFLYDDAYFDLVIAGEIIEHLISDPMHLLLECRRVLDEGGHLLISTPNAASLTSVARALHGYDNPQIYSKYSREMPHVREYTAHELRKAVESAGFEIATLFTETDGSKEYVEAFLEEHGYNPELRGEQTWCIGIKRSNLPVTRYPTFLYDES